MAWSEKTVETWSDYTRETGAVLIGGPRQNPAILFRGQADTSWRLKPSLLRIPGTDDAQYALRLEEIAFAEFTRRAHKYASKEDVTLPDANAAPFLWWGLMQHYGAPTRVIDWTGSRDVAAYFAVESPPAKDAPPKDAFVYYSAPYHVQKFMRRKYPEIADIGVTSMAQLIDPLGPMLLLPYHGEAEQCFRITAQQAHFYFCLNVLGDHENIIDAALDSLGPNVKPYYGRLRIPAASKAGFLRELASIGITAETMYSGMAGLGKSVMEQCSFPGNAV